MLPNLSNLSVDTNSEPKLKIITKKLIERGRKLDVRRKSYSFVWDKWKQSIADHFATDKDLLADGVGYRCENTLHELFNGSWYGGLGHCLHMAWDEFHTYYGHTCAMFSTRALQNCGFKMMHGARWSPGLLHMLEDSDASDYHTDWLLDMWVKSRREATENYVGWKSRLRDEDRFKEPSAYAAKLLERWANGEWQIPEGEEWEWDTWWSTQTQESKDEFEVLSEQAVKSAPWWVLRYTPSDFEPELLEFSVSSPEGDRDKLIKLSSCVLALVKHSGGHKQVVYSLPFGVKPGSEAAQEHAERILMRMYDHES